MTRFCEFAIPPTARGGLIHTLSDPTRPLKAAGSLLAGPDVSWTRYWTAKGNQGPHGSCVVQAYRAVHSIVENYLAVQRGEPMRVWLRDSEAQKVYQIACHDLGRGDAGLTAHEGWTAVARQGWLRLADGIQRETDFTNLRKCPYIIGVRVTKALDNVSDAGCMDHAASYYPDRGYHMMCVSAVGALDRMPGETWIQIANSWGIDWGYCGLCMMNSKLHAEITGEMWSFVGIDLTQPNGRARDAGRHDQ